NCATAQSFHRSHVSSCASASPNNRRAPVNCCLSISSSACWCLARANSARCVGSEFIERTSAKQTGSIQRAKPPRTRIREFYCGELEPLEGGTRHTAANLAPPSANRQRSDCPNRNRSPENYA